MAGIFNSAIFNNAIFNTGEAPPTPVPTEFTPVEGVGTRRRIRQRIVLRIDGQEHEVRDLAQALEIIKAAKAEAPAVAQATASEIVKTGRKVGQARKKEASAIEVVQAPSSVLPIIEERIAEMQRFYWKRVQAFAKALDDDDEEVTAYLLL